MFFFITTIEYGVNITDLCTDQDPMDAYNYNYNYNDYTSTDIDNCIYIESTSSYEVKDAVFYQYISFFWSSLMLFPLK